MSILNQAQTGMLFFIFLFLVFNEGIGQEHNVLKGQIVALEKIPVPYAHIMLMDHNLKIAASGVSDNKGNFTLPVVKKGKYQLNISCVGFEVFQQEIVVKDKQQELGVFKLKEGIQLDEVVIMGKQHLLHVKPDRIIYEVEKDSSAKNSVAIQVLGKLPFVRIDPKAKELKVMNGSNYIITINGKKSLYLSEVNQHVTNLLRGDKIKQIELIISPEGKFSDKTAVINIITQGSLPDGIAGNVELYGSQHFVMLSAGVTSKIKRLVYNITYQPRYIYSPKLTNNTRMINYLNELLHETISEQTNWSKNYIQHLRLDASYDFTDYDIITFSGMCRYHHEREYDEGKAMIFSKKGMEVQSYFFEDQNTKRSTNWSGNVNLQKTSQKDNNRLFTATYRMECNDYKNSYNQTQISSIEELTEEQTNKLRLTEHTIGVDFSNPVLDKHTIFLTAKYVARRYRSDEELKYNQHVQAFRASYSYSASKFMLTAEVSFERTINKMLFGVRNVHKDFFEVTPRSTIRFMLNKKSSLALSYSVPSFRPDIRLLNPFVDQSNPTHWNVGNPNLEPEKTHTFLANYLYGSSRADIAFEVKYKHSKNAIYPYDYTNQSGILVTTYGNTNRSKILSFSLNIGYNLSEKLELWSESKVKYTHYAVGNENFSLWSFDVDVGGKVTLFKKAFIETTAWLEPVSTSVQDTKFHYVIKATLRAGYNFNQRLSLMIDADKFLKKHLNVEKEKKTDSFYQHRNEQWQGRTISLSLSYRFGRLNDKVKKSSREIKNLDREKKE